jgi:hypothetical protein
MKLFLRQGFLSAAQQQFPGGPDEKNVAELNNAVDEYAMAAAFQQQLLNPLTPTVVTQVAPPPTWYGQSVGGTRILYDNPRHHLPLHGGQQDVVVCDHGPLHRRNTVRHIIQRAGRVGRDDVVDPGLRCRSGERKSDVIRRALRLLEKEVWDQAGARRR